MDGKEWEANFEKGRNEKKKGVKEHKKKKKKRTLMHVQMISLPLVFIHLYLAIVITDKPNMGCQSAPSYLFSLFFSLITPLSLSLSLSFSFSHTNLPMNSYSVFHYRLSVHISSGLNRKYPLGFSFSKLFRSLFFSHFIN